MRAAPRVFSFALRSQRDRKFLLPSLLTLGSQTSKFWILLFRYASIPATSSHEPLENVLFMLCPGCFPISRIFTYGCVCWIIAFVGAAPILQHVHQWRCFSSVCVRKIDWWEEGVRWAPSRQSKGQDLCLIHSRGCTCTWICSEALSYWAICGWLGDGGYGWYLTLILWDRAPSAGPTFVLFIN